MQEVHWLLFCVCVLLLIFCFYLFSGIRGSLVADSAAKDALGGDVQMNLYIFFIWNLSLMCNQTQAYEWDEFPENKPH